MREIKFRAWNTEKKTLYPPSSIWKMNLMGYEDSCNLVLMQYTGLKDKNGVEIYEGDIVRDEDDRFNDILVIEWQSEQVGINGWEYGTGYTGFVARNTRYKSDGEIRGISQSGGHSNYGDTNLYTDDFEIIGNIYENKELLNEK